MGIDCAPDERVVEEHINGRVITGYTCTGSWVDHYSKTRSGRYFGHRKDRDRHCDGFYEFEYEFGEYEDDVNGPAPTSINKVLNEVREEYALVQVTHPETGEVVTATYYCTGVDKNGHDNPT